MITFGGRKSDSDMTGRSSIALNTALFQSDFPLLIHSPLSPKKIKMYFMKLLYMKHLLAVIKWTI